MSLNLEEFNIALESFGTVTYSLISPSQENQTEYFEFAVQNVNYLYSLSNFGEFCKRKCLLIIFKINLKKQLVMVLLQEALFQCICFISLDIVHTSTQI